MNNKAGTAKPKSGSRFSTSLIIGLLLVPLSAVAAVALVNPDAAAESEEAVAAEFVAETTTTAAAEEIVIPEIASADDLAAACGDEGWTLVAKEADATISPLEQAALDSLRAICLSEGLELPGPPAPEAVVQTVTVVASPPPATSGDAGSGTTTDAAAAEFEAEYAAIVSYINAAIADGASGDKIAQAERFLAEAGSLADSGDYEGGMAKLRDARQAADEASRSSHDDDDDHDEEDEEDEDEEDDDHGDDDEDDD